ncbi:MAG: putative toxin-antitoxin system toxin component, PIN family [Candidatus Pacearchaeota archaeon]|jgi:hypothetical protein
MRVILDTNVFISGIFWEGNFCSQLIDKWKNNKFDLVYSIEILEELIKTLSNFKIQMSDEMIEDWRNLIIGNSIIVEPLIKLDIIKDDPEDNKFLEAAIAGKVNIIVSQDKHLLKLKEYENIKIINPEIANDLL